MQELGFHYRITDIQASLAVSQIKRIKSFVNKRFKIYNNYAKAFSNIKGIGHTESREIFTIFASLYDTNKGKETTSIDSKYSIA